MTKFEAISILDSMEKHSLEKEREAIEYASNFMKFHDYMFDAYGKFPKNIMELAVAYAYGMINYGLDVTQKLETAVQQLYALHRAERIGYMQAIADKMR